MEKRYGNTYIDNKFDEICSSMRAIAIKLKDLRAYTFGEAFYIQNKLVEWFPEKKEDIYNLFKSPYGEENIEKGVSNNE